jgi:hypothetical protein
MEIISLDRKSFIPFMDGGPMRFKGFDLNLLVALDALLGERSASRAAQNLNVTQPA